MDTSAHYTTKSKTVQKITKRSGKEFPYPYESKVYVCKHCSKECKSLQTMKMHLTTHLDKISPKFSLNATTKSKKTIIEKVKKDEGVLEEQGREEKVKKQVRKSAKKQKEMIKKRVKKTPENPPKQASESIKEDFFEGFYD
tara:strand:- start:469 stop:891 length:423 start_codon:yes stop_codon:yes gene_type:complete